MVFVEIPLNFGQKRKQLQARYQNFVQKRIEKLKLSADTTRTTRLNVSRIELDVQHIVNYLSRIRHWPLAEFD